MSTILCQLTSPNDEMVVSSGRRSSRDQARGSEKKGGNEGSSEEHDGGVKWSDGR